MSNEYVGTTAAKTTTTAETKNKEEEDGDEYEEEFVIEVRTQKGSSIKAESSSFKKLDELLNKAITTYQRLSKEESGDVVEKQQYQ